MSAARFRTMIFALVALPLVLQLPGIMSAHAGTATGFLDRVVLSGLSVPTQVQFAADGRVFVAEKGGVIKVFDGLSDTTPTVFADLSTQVDDYWDRGLLGLALDPQFTTGRPFVYALYTYDAPIGGTAPTWNDDCPSPPGPTTNGCLVSGRLVKLTAAGDVATGDPQVLINDWCQQFPSHSIGTVLFGNDGALYAGGGDGASFNYAEWGQAGNACGDPPSAVGRNLSPPTAEGGALRSQSVRRTDGPATLNGSIIRVDPDTGAGLPSNPFASVADTNRQRVIAYGLRNPFRFTTRPGTDQLWVGDVGMGTWEEIDKITATGDGSAENFGWPCYEGSPRQPQYDAANLNLCESLYTGTGQRTPAYSYKHGVDVVPGDGCATSSGSSITGLAFYNGTSYPASYRGALFFADHSRGCVWAMLPGASGDPDPAQIQTIVTGVNPVQLVAGPNGDIFYAGIDDGRIHEITYPAGNAAPTAAISVDPASGAAPLTVNLDGSGSTDPDAQSLSYSWDLDGDGTYGDATGATAAATYTTTGAHTVRLKVSDPAGASDTATTTVTVTGGAPTATLTSPTATDTYQVGSTVGFTGGAVDSTGQPLPASALAWTLVMHHCPTKLGCHTHQIQTWRGSSAGSFVAPDHGYPSYLELQLTATDPANGQSTASTVQLKPRTATISMQTSPTTLRVSVDGTSRRAPFTVRVVRGHSTSLIAPLTQWYRQQRYTFGGWSDGGAATHSTVVSAYTTLTVNY